MRLQEDKTQEKILKFLDDQNYFTLFIYFVFRVNIKMSSGSAQNKTIPLRKFLITLLTGGFL